MPEKVYVVVLEERHIGVDVSVFSDLDEANIAAWGLAEGYCRDEEALEDTGDDDLIFIRFSEEGGYVSVVEKEIQ
jgi:hypothetical protein